MSHTRHVISISVCALLLFVVLAFFVVTQLTDSADTAVLLAMNSYEMPLLDGFFLGITHLGGVIATTVASILLCIALAHKKHYKKLLFVVGSMTGMIVVNLVLKVMFNRPRPALWELLVTAETSLSFPSGHATASLALALVVLFLVWRTRFRGLVIGLGAAYVVLVGVSRLYLGVHYPTDVIGGWLLAMVWVSLMAALILRTPRKSIKESRPA